MNSLRAKIPEGRTKFKVGDLVRITKEKVKFAKRYEQTFPAEIFRVVKDIQRVPQPVYELSYSQSRSIEGHFYNYELVKVTFSSQTEFYCTRNTGGIKQHPVKWRGYDETFNSWVNVSDIKEI